MMTYIVQHNFKYPNEHHIAQETPHKGVPSMGEGQEIQYEIKDSLTNKTQAKVCEIRQFHFSQCKCSSRGALQDLRINPL